MDDLLTSRDEWQLLVSEVKSDLKSISTRKQTSDEQAEVSALHHKLGEIDWFHRRLQSSYDAVLDEQISIEKSSKLMGDFFALAPIGNLVLSEKGFVTHANRTAAEYWGIEQKDLVGIGLLGLVSAEHIAALSRALDEVTKKGQRRSIDIRCMRPGGQPFWGRFALVLEQNNASGEARVLCSVVDFTSNQLLEDAIRKTAIGLSASTGEPFFQELVDFLRTYPSIDHAVVMSSDDEENYSSISFSSLLGDEANSEPLHFKKGSLRHGSLSQRGSVNSENLDDILDHDNYCGYFKAQDLVKVPLSRGDGVVAGELVLLTNTRFFDRKLFKSVLKIVSPRVEAELQRLESSRKLKEYQDQLEELVERRTTELIKKNARLQSEVEKRLEIEKRLLDAKSQAEKAVQVKSAFLANMSHEIRTPLNGVIGVTTLIENQPLNTVLRKYVNTIKSSGHSLLQIVNDILDISKFDSNNFALELQEFSVRTLLNEICDSHITKAEEKGIFLFIDYPQEAPLHVVSDRVRVRQVIENLVSNAIKFTDTGYVIVKASYDTERSFLRVQVEDTGIGLDDSQRKVIFQRFTQADSSTTRKYGGTGLGLSISKRIADLLKGSLVCSSRVDEGSTFSLSVPVEFCGKEKRQTHIAEVCEDTLFCIALSSAVLSRRIQDRFEESGLKCTTWNSKLEVENVPSECKRVVVVSNIKGPNVTAPESLRTNSSLVIPIGQHEEFNLRKQLKSIGKIELHRGPLSVGSLLSCIIKARLQPKVQRATVKRASPVPDLMNCRVLIAEDNEINRMVIIDMLKACGAKVEVACNGAEAVELYVKSPRFDVVLMDCLMPVMDGFQALKNIKGLDCFQSPIVALTANAMSGDREECMRQGFDEYIAKPIRLADLKSLSAWLKARELAEEPLATDSVPMPAQQDRVHQPRLSANSSG